MSEHTRVRSNGTGAPCCGSDLLVLGAIGALAVGGVLVAAAAAVLVALVTATAVLVRRRRVSACQTRPRSAAVDER